MTKLIIGAIIGVVGLVGGWLGINGEVENTFGAFSDPFISLQVGTDPTSGDILTTDGTDSSWVTPASLGLGGSSSGVNWELSTNAYSQSGLAPTTTQNIIISGTGTSTFAGNIEVTGDIKADTIEAGTLIITASVFDSSLTQNSVLFVGAGGEFTEDTSFVYNSSKLGVGTSSPFAQLSVEGQGGTAFAISDTSNNTDFIVDSSGQVGIGTASPGAKLDVIGSITGRTSAGSNNGAFIYDTSGGNSRLTLYNSTGNGTFRFDSDSSNDSYMLTSLGVGDSSPDGMLEVRQTGTDDIFNLYDSTTNVFTVLDGGNVGIGTSTPLAKLHVSNGFNRVATNYDVLFEDDGALNVLLTGASASDIDIDFGDSDATVKGRVRYSNSIDALNLWSNGSQRMTINSSGNVGIGTTSPQGKLHVYDSFVKLPTSGVDNIVIEENANSGMSILSGSANSGNIYFGDNDNSTIGRIIYDHSTNDLSLWAGGIELITMLSGNVGIGTSTPAHLLDVDGDFRVGEEGSSNALFVDATQGRVGIGTASPEEMIHISGGNLLLSNDTDIMFDAASGVALQVFTVNSADNISIGNNSLDDIIFNVGSIPSALILKETTGNLGIGTTSPQKKFSVTGAAVTQEVNLTDGATITFDLDNGNQGRVVLGGNRAFELSNETDAAGQSVRIVVCQDGTGSRTITSWDSNIRWAGGSAPTLTTTADKCDVLAGFITMGTSTPIVVLDSVLNF